MEERGEGRGERARPRPVIATLGREGTGPSPLSPLPIDAQPAARPVYTLFLITGCNWALGGSI